MSKKFGNTMTFDDFKKLYAEKHGVSKEEAGNAVKTVLEELFLAALEGRAVTVPGYGTFYIKSRAARKGRNPKTKEEIMIPASKAFAWDSSEPAKKRAKALPIEE